MLPQDQEWSREMLEDAENRLDYFALVKRAKRLPPPTSRRLKLAVLGDVSTQHLMPLLRVLFAEREFRVDLYEGGFDTVELDALDPSSQLYAFEPDIIVILQGLRKLSELFYEYRGDRSNFVEQRAHGMESVWRAIRARTAAPVVQSTFVLPYERAFGNYSLLAADNLYGASVALNREIVTRAANHQGILINDVDYIAAWHGRRHFIDEKLQALSKSICSLELLPHLAQNVVDIALTTQGRGVKCVILDLDNTLWGGVIGDDGLDGIELGDNDPSGAFRAFQLYLRELRRRGIVLAVCSKNQEDVALSAFREHPGMVLREDDISVFVANWDDKASNIRLIREKLNIGFDAMVFLDDNPFERNLVRQLLPEVTVPELPEDPALYVRAVSELNLFEVASFSALDAKRSGLYQVQAQREKERSRFDDLDSYLKSLETTARVARFEPKDLPRIAQLLQRSNQFNLTTRRHPEALCGAMMDDPAYYYPFTITVSDRFGDFGLVSVIVLEHHDDEIEVNTFVMSCRVLQRGVEQLAMNEIFSHARQLRAKRVLGRYIPSPKNAMVKGLFPKFGFSEIATEQDGTTVFALDVADYSPRTVHIREVRDPEEWRPNESRANS